VPAPEIPFERRIAGLPKLGVGISTEFGAARDGLDVLALRRTHPEWVQFLEIGIDLERGIDTTAREWVAAGWPTTYHFLDLSLEERESLDDLWASTARELALELDAAWICGDAGLWHLGPRDRGHGVLMPPVLCAASADTLAENLRRARRATGFEVLPENPPAHAYLGDMHLLDYFARVVERADSGLLLDVAHLTIYQDFLGCDLFHGLERFPLERIVELHVAGGSRFEHEGRAFIDDDHTPEPLPETWALFDYLLPRTPSLRAIVYECERNTLDAVAPGFERIAKRVRELSPW